MCEGRCWICARCPGIERQCWNRSGLRQDQHRHRTGGDEILPRQRLNLCGRDRGQIRQIMAQRVKPPGIARRALHLIHPEHIAR